MKLKLDEIKIGKRLRQQFTDVTMLKESIREVGLLNPVIVNEKNELISGFRRFEACRQLGWQEIEANVLETSNDDVKKLEIEYHENLGRVDLTSDDRIVYKQRMYSLLNPPKTEKGFLAWLKNIWNFLMGIFTGKTKK